MNNNSGLLIALAAMIGISGMCCVGSGAAYFLLRSRASSPPPAAVYPAPSYPAPSYPAPTPPPYPYPPSGPAIPPAPVGAPLTETLDTPVRGPLTPAITIHVVSDYQCPFCSRVEPTLAQLDAAYPGQIRWVWHDYPLPFHQDAMPAAEAAREVRRQLGDAAYWSYHDRLFAAQASGLDGRSLEALAAGMPGIDVARFRTSLVTHEHEAEVRASIAQVDATHGSTGTPSFLIGQTWMAGAQPYESFRAEVARQVGH